MTTRHDLTPEEQNRLDIEAALRNCAEERLHQIGSIQPLGVLVAVDPTSLTVQAASENLEIVFGVDCRRAMGLPLRNLVGDMQLTRLQALVDLGNMSGAMIWSFILEQGGETRKFDAQVFHAGHLLVIEVEQEQPHAGDVFHDLFIPIRDALWKLDAESDMERYAQAVVDQLRILTGFDRVMMYRFDTNWDGEVIAESKVAEVASYLGNRFPASDIPPQARELYTKNLVRLIADVDAHQVALACPGDGNTAATVDLTYSWLRSMSPVHVEYLRNMGVKASLSISLVQNNRLWGLIACHHYTPKYVSLRERELDEFIGRSVSLKLINMDNAERTALGGRIRELLYELTDLIRRNNDLDSVVHVIKDSLLGLVRASGAIVTINGGSHILGHVPSEGVRLRLLDVLRRHPPAPVYHSEQLSELIGTLTDAESLESDIASGMLVAPLDSRMDNFIMWFRPGVLRTLRWAGNPEKKLIKEGGGVRLSPRGSFETWIETYREKSLAWSQAEIDAANSLSLALIEVLTQKALKASEESYRLLAENSTDMIASLDLEGRVCFVSPSCRDLLGCDTAELVGQYLWRFLGEDEGVIRRLIDEVNPLGSLVTSVVRGRRPDGSPLWVEATLKHTLGRHGQGEIVLNARDVTQRYNYQLAIEEVHRRNARILDAAGEGLVSLNGEGTIVYANEVALRLLQRGLPGLIGSHCCEVLCCVSGSCSCHQDRDTCPFLTTLRDGETRQGQHSLAVVSENPLLVNYVCTPLVESGNIIGCVVVFSEAGALAAVDSDMATEVILDQAVEAVMVTDTQGRITSVNRAFSEITGFSADEAIGHTPKIIKSGVHTPHFYEEFWRALRDARRWTGEIWNRRKNGEVYPQWGSVTAILDATGEVRNYVAVFSDISKAKQAEEKLYHLANHDSLTGLPNRMRFTEQLTKTLDRNRRTGTGLAVAFIDLDRFKMINDTLGHAIGDVYLKIVAERLVAATRKQDTLARWGGDEFVLLLEELSDRQAIADAMKRLLEQLGQPIYLEGHELLPTASIGISLYPKDGRSAPDLIKAADAAMYRAKEAGRDGFEFFAQSMGKELDDKLLLATELRHALQEQQFFLVYQPQVDTVSGELIGVEALVRWRHPTRGVLAPLAFLPLVDEFGLMEELGEWVLAAACRQMRLWLENGTAIPRVAVNVAPCQLKASFVDAVAQVLADTGVAPECLEIEITEGSLESGELARTITSGLRNLGVLLSVDDFGTGYSSLSHIKMFPITCFKIDKSFVDGVPDNDDDVAIVRTILALGSSLHVDVVAEGAETRKQVEFLRSEGVKYIQGYYFGRPMLPEALDAYLAKRR